MTVSPTSKTLKTGETVQLTATKNPSTATEGITWTSSNSSVATVNQNGLVTAKGSGTATITIKNSESKVSTNCVINVINDGNFLIPTGDALLKCDKDGNLLWKQRYIYTDVQRNYYNINQVEETNDGNIFISTGDTLLKCDKDGNLLWKKRYTSTEVPINYYTINQVEATNDGNIFMSTGDTLLKCDKDGNLLWKKRYTSTEVPINYYTINQVEAMF